MDEISVKGKTYLKAKVVARELGYTNDYVGQLCRAGKVDAELVGRTWYVDPNSIKGHKSTRYRSAKVSTRRELKEHVQRNLREQKEQVREAVTVHLNGAGERKEINYAADEAELIPVTKKSHHEHATKVSVSDADAKKVKVAAKSTDTSFVAPEREKTKFFGTLKVTDFMTEVPVSGDDENVMQSVPVHDANEAPVRSVFLEQEPAGKEEQVLIKQLTKNHRHAEVPDTKRVEVSAAVVAESEEVVSLPIFYRVAPATAAIAGLAIAALLVGLESTSTVTSEAISTTYAFVVENVSALLYIAE